MSEYFKFRRIMKVAPLVVVIVALVGDDCAHVSFKILGNRSEHVRRHKKQHTINETQQNHITVPFVPWVPFR